MKLPIEYIPNTNPPKFRWYQPSPIEAGAKIKHESTVSPNLEIALLKLIQLAMNQEDEILSLKIQVKGHTARIAAQSEIITKQAEKPQPREISTPQSPVNTPSKKGK